MTSILNRIFGLVLLVFVSSAALAQIATQEKEIPPDSIAIGFVPAVAYNSDFGLIVGGIINRYDYRGGKPPFRTYTNAYAVVSTKGLFRLSVKFDQVQTFGRPIRSYWEGYTFRAFNDYYFGIGNNTVFDRNRFVNENTYYFQSFGYGLTWRGRKALWRGPGIERFDVLFGGNFSYQTPFENGPDRLIMQDLPAGVRGGNTNYGIIGLMLEKRDSEFRPTTGYMLYTEFNAAHRITGSNFNLTRLTATGSAYGTFHFIRDITAAGRVGWMQTTGEVPYWMLSRLGGDGSLRGFPVNRFSDRHALFYNAELRTWLWDWEDGLLRIGGQLFFDGGRVFPRGVPRGFFDDHHYVIGFGGAMSAFTPDFFIRGDVGFSKELYRIYISVGYAF